MKYNNLLATVALVTLAACNTTGTVASSSDFNTVKSESNITMPKYFFTDEVNKTCKMGHDGNSNNFYSSTLNNSYDFTNKDDYEWLKNMVNYNWKEDHAKRSNSLNVEMHQLTDRMEYINTTLTNAIIDGTMEVQAPLAIDLIMAFAENDFIMDSTTVQDIRDMKAAGKTTKCYKGKGNEKATCHWHTAQEAARFSGQVAITANLVRPYMNYKHLTFTENYLNALYKDYIAPWYESSGSGDTDGDGFYQMGHGAVSLLAYAQWKNDKELATYAFESTFDYIDSIVFDGYIDNNSFRGVRGYWYHSVALNNMLGMVALAEEWNYPVEDKILNKLTDAVEFLNQDPVEWTATLEALDKWSDFDGKSNITFKRNIYVGNASWKQKNSRLFMHQETIFLPYMAETYTKASINPDTNGMKIYKYKGRNKINDQQLGFNPTCITR